MLSLSFKHLDIRGVSTKGISKGSHTSEDFMINPLVQPVEFIGNPLVHTGGVNENFSDVFRDT